MATQCAAVTTHRLFKRAPPHDNFFDKNPDLIIAAFINKNVLLLQSELIIITLNLEYTGTPPIERTQPLDIAEIVCIQLDKN